MSTQSNDTDNSTDNDRFRGDYNAFGAMGKMTSEPRILVWIHGRDDMKFGIHHGRRYSDREVFGWLMNNVRSVPFDDVESEALARGEELVVHLGPNHEPKRIEATDIFEQEER